MTKKATAPPEDIGSPLFPSDLILAESSIAGDRDQIEVDAVEKGTIDSFMGAIRRSSPRSSLRQRRSDAHMREIARRSGTSPATRSNSVASARQHSLHRGVRQPIIVAPAATSTSTSPGSFPRPYVWPRGKWAAPGQDVEHHGQDHFGRPPEIKEKPRSAHPDRIPGSQAIGQGKSNDEIARRSSSEDTVRSISKHLRKHDTHSRLQWPSTPSIPRSFKFRGTHHGHDEKIPASESRARRRPHDIKSPGERMAFRSPLTASVSIAAPGPEIPGRGPHP